METRDILTVLAILFAPLFAIQIQKWIEVFREKQGRKLAIFRTLMSTRRATLSAYHVEALNSIDTEFSKKRKKEKAVLDAWKVYLDHLHDLEEKPTKAQLEAWLRKKDDLFIDLLFSVSRAVGYDFDKVHLRRSVYSPKAHGDVEMDIKTIRENLVSILSGEQPIPMTIVLSKETIAKQEVFQDAFLGFLDGRRSLRVKIDDEPKNLVKAGEGDSV